MAWEYRGNKRYYYRKKRQGDRVVTEYIGTGTIAALSAEADRQKRGRSLCMQRLWKEQRIEYEAMDPDCQFLTAILRGLVRATYLTAGYHSHKGQWRKNRHGQ